jgi:tRNA 2-thiouridine synthesizing protein C
MTKPDYIVIQSTQAPYSSSYAIDAIEAAMGATNIGLEVVFIFVGEGVYQLQSNQDNNAISHKSIFKKLLALPLYDIEKVCVLSSSLSQYKVTIPQSIPNLSTLSDIDFVSLCSDAKQVLVF